MMSLEMGLTLSTSNVHVCNYIHDDILFSLLSKLPLKSLKRFESVCKSWSLLFDKPYFMTMFRNYFISKDHSFYDDISFLLHLRNQGLLYSLSGERSENNKVRFAWEELSLRDRNNNFSFDIKGPNSFNGTLCLQYYNNYGHKKFMLWKPTTTEFRIIYTEYTCSSKAWYDHYQVGYDHVKDDYKIIRRTHRSPRTSNCRVSAFWEIFSKNDNYWSKIVDDNFPHSYRCSEEVYVDGVSHWCEKIEARTHLVSLDFSKESFITTPVPSYTDNVFDFNSKSILTLLNGSIALIVNHEETSIFDISILGELGVKESWIKLFIIGPLPCLKIPIGIGKKGNILIRKKDNELAWFDISTGTIDEIGVTADADTSGKIYFHK